MHFLYLVAVLATVTLAPIEPAESPPTEPVVTTPLAVTVSPFVLAEPPRGSPLDLGPLSSTVSFRNELNGLYRRYRAEGRFRGGVGVSFSLFGEKRNRWTLIIGPVQFRFGGQRSEPATRNR